ncbi:MAG TPA: GH116 family glycosyl hydrolase [Ktedonobacterales bacterium]|nr:GH116 family glycosyl hydrolase [Ktedonobacterales bacterium]
MRTESFPVEADIARGLGHSARVAVYSVPDNQMAVGSTLGGPRVCAIIKGTGAIEKVYSIDLGETVFGALVLHHWDERTGTHLAPLVDGTFTLHPEHQEHTFTLLNEVAVHEDIFVLSGKPEPDGTVDPPAVYYTVDLRNDSDSQVCIASYAFCQLRGETNHDIVATYDRRLGALLAWNQSQPDLVRVFGCSEKPTSFETTVDYARAVAPEWPGELANTTDAPGGETLGVLHLSHTLKPGAHASFAFLLSFSGEGRHSATQTYRACPSAAEALDRTRAHYHEVLNRAVVLTPSVQVNRGVLWAKANMLRVQSKSPTGWCFVNDPTRSNNSVARDTAWFGYGADYLTPDFVRDSLLKYVQLQEKRGMIVEYYDIRTNKTADYGLNINDNTPLLILALWHHYTATGDDAFLREVYPSAAKAARYLLAQRNEQGLVWCTATGTSDWGIVGWRNVIKNYRLSGATTEVNSECFAALQMVSQMARVLGKHDESATFASEAAALKEAINAHLLNPENGLYYLNLDIDGQPRSDVTVDLVFPVMFGVASEATAARIIKRLSGADFWTSAGIRTVPRDAPNYSPGPEPAYGLMGGVWVAATIWYAFAAARFTPEFMAHALSSSFQHYSRDPRQNGTVPGQFSEWLHGETLVNQGMMLSPWFPPRFLWAAIEGAAGLDLSADTARIEPHLAPEWQWMGVQNLPYRGQNLTWLAVRTPTVQLYTNYHFHESTSYIAFEEDITAQVHAAGAATVALGFRQGEHLLLFVGNTDKLRIATALYVETDISGAYRMNVYDSLLGHWEDQGLVQTERLRQGIPLQIERQGFWLFDLTQAV